MIRQTVRNNRFIRILGSLAKNIYSRSFLKICVSILLLYFATLNVDLPELIRVYDNVDSFMLFLAFIIFFAGQVLSAIRYKILFDATGAEITLPHSLNIHFIALFFNQILPSSLGGDAIKGIYMAKSYSTQKAINSVIADRMHGLFILCFMVLLLFPFYFFLIQNIGLFLLITGIAILGVFGVPAFLFILNVIEKFWPNGRNMFSNFFGFSHLRSFAEYYLQTFMQKSYILLFLISLFIHFSGIGTFFIIARALGLDVLLFDFVILIPLIFLVSLVPISFGGWGVREFGSIWCLGLIGVSKEYALFLSIIFGVILLLVSMPGLYLFLRKIRKHA